MEKNVFKFGESSVALILPKKWVDKEGLMPKGRVNISEGSGGELILSVKTIKNKETERYIDKGMAPVFIARWIGIHYMYGTNKLRLYSKDGFSPAQLEAIDQKLNGDCIGFEITGQSNKEVVIEDLTNIKEIDLDKIFSRLRFLVDQEFNEILNGKPETIRKLEQHVNRFYMLGIRYVNIIQPQDYLGHIGILNLLEQTSDAMKEIRPETYAKSKPIVMALYSQFKLCYDAQKGNEGAIMKMAEMRVGAEKLISKAKIGELDSHLLLCITNNLAGIGEYGFRAEKEAVDYS